MMSTPLPQALLLPPFVFNNDYSLSSSSIGNIELIICFNNHSLHRIRFTVSVLLLNTASTGGFAAELMQVFDAACLLQYRILIRLRGVRWVGFTGFLAFSTSLVLLLVFALSQVLHDVRLLFRNFKHNSNGQLPSLRSRPPPQDVHIMASRRSLPVWKDRFS